MNVIQANKISRKDLIIRTKEAIMEALKKKLKPKKEFIVLEMMSRGNISERTAKEWLKLVLYELELDDDLEKSEERSRWKDAQRKLC